MSVTFDSVTIPYAKVRAGPMPWRQKEWTYPGTDGVESLGMGKGKRTITVVCMSTGSPSRSTLEGKLGETGTLNANGESYGNVKLMAVGVPVRVNTTAGYVSYIELLFQQETPD